MIDIQLLDLLRQIGFADFTDQNRFFTSPGAGGYFHLAFPEPQSFGQQPDAGLVGCPFHRRSGNFHFQHPLRKACDAGPRCVRIDMDVKGQAVLCFPNKERVGQIACLSKLRAPFGSWSEPEKTVKT